MAEGTELLFQAGDQSREFESAPGGPPKTTQAFGTGRSTVVVTLDTSLRKKVS